MGELVAQDFGNHQCVLKGEGALWLEDACLQSSRLDMLLLVLGYRAFIYQLYALQNESPWLIQLNILGCCLAPISIDAVLQLDDCEVANFGGKGVVNEDVLSKSKSAL